ncbi:MAG: ABC transporter ATP-binding protein, partial [Hungatella sp.]
DCLKIVGIVISIALFSLQLGLLALLLIPLISVITRNFQRKLLIAHTQNLKQLGRVNNHISESMKNIFMIKAYSKEEYMEGLYEKRLQDNFTTIERVNFYDSCYAPIIQLIRAAVISAVVLLSFGQQSVLGISLGMVAASIDLIANLFAPVEALGMELQSIQKGISGAKRIDEFLGQSEAEEKDRQITAEAICAPESTAAFAFEGVSFSYADAEKPVLSEITLTIEPGESVTFAGRTGVGKTTLFKLIMGLEKPTQGHITLGGVDVCKIPNDQKRRLLGYVEQNFSFVEGTVAQQISLDEEGITREQVEKALAFVGLLDSVNAMEAGLDTPIKSQDDFSQGQKQLLAIARAIVTNPPVLLLDEVTANLDSTTEENVVRILGEVGQKRTILSVSHRLTSLLHCDRVVMLEDGRIRRIGTPTELASLRGTN